MQGAFFVLVLPAFNLLYLALILWELGYLEPPVLGAIALRMYTAFALAYALILSLEHLFPTVLAEERFWPQLALHIGAVFLVSRWFDPVLAETPVALLPRPSVIPVVFMIFQLTLYVLVKNLIVQRELHLATQLNLRQAKINVLRAQTNPHFLFNTLNLLASEIKRDPDVAQDIVYDLADLLRDSMRAADRKFVRLDEELQLVKLYLTLQKKRFPERLAFDICVEGDCGQRLVPSLLLQPVVENVIKHVVAHTTAMTSVRIGATTDGHSMILRVDDNGPRIDTRSLEPKEGLRIVRETLALHYHGQATLTFESTDHGGRVIITIPTDDACPVD